jgi:Asp-tRNA(Asn)/Glu-tRNA(Gln) amidotransferase C subunit
VILWNIIPDERPEDIVRHEEQVVETDRMEMGELDKHVKGSSSMRGDEEYEDLKIHEAATSRIEPVQ